MTQFRKYHIASSRKKRISLMIRNQIISFCSSKFFKDFSIVFIFDILAKIILLLILLLTVRLLSPLEYAFFVKFNSLANLLLGIFASGIGIAFVRSVSDLSSVGRISLVKSLYLLSLSFILVIFLPVFFCSHFLSGIYKFPVYLIVLSLFYALTLSYLKINQFYFQGQEKYFTGGLVELIRTGAIFFLISIVYLFSGTISILQLCLIYIISGLVVCGILFKEIFSFTTFKFNKKVFLYAKLLLSESAWLLFYCFLLAFLGQADIILLSFFASDTEIANYGVAQKYQSLALSLLPALLALMRVKTAKRDFSYDPIKRRDFTRKWIKSTSPCAIVVILIGIFLSQYIMPLLNGTQYNAAIPLFQIMLIGVGISYVFSPNVPILMAAKRFSSLCVLCFIALLITVVGNYLLIPSLGAISPAIFFVISNAFLNICATLFISYDAASWKKQQKSDVFIS